MAVSLDLYSKHYQLLPSFYRDLVWQHVDSHGKFKILKRPKNLNFDLVDTRDHSYIKTWLRSFRDSVIHYALEDLKKKKKFGLFFAVEPFKDMYVSDIITHSGYGSDVAKLVYDPKTNLTFTAWKTWKIKPSRDDKTMVKVDGSETYACKIEGIGLSL